MIENEYKLKLDAQKRQIVFALDERFVKYFSVTLMSLYEHLDIKSNYEISILYTNISNESIDVLTKNVPSNVLIRFIDVSDALGYYFNGIDFFETEVWSKAIWYRLMVPFLFADASRVLYLDSDLCIEDNIDELFNINLNGYCCAAVPDLCATDWQELFGITLKDALGLDDDEKYFNTGMLLWNIPLIENAKYLNDIKYTFKTAKLICPDQCLLNVVFKNKCKLLDFSYNLQINLLVANKNILQRVGRARREHFLNGLKNVKIIHYATNIKPWNDSRSLLQDRFWWYAIRSPYIKELLDERFASSDIESVGHEMFVMNNKNYYLRKFLLHYFLRFIFDKSELKCKKYKELYKKAKQIHKRLNNEIMA